MKLKNRVEVRAYDDKNILKLSEEMDINNWYDDLHVIIDSDEFRRRESIVRVEIVQYQNDILASRCTNIYDKEGRLVEEIEKNSQEKITRHMKTVYDRNGNFEEKDLLA